MAKTKVSEIAKKLAAVNPDSIVLKNKEPRPVNIIIKKVIFLYVPLRLGEGGAW